MCIYLIVSILFRSTATIWLLWAFAQFGLLAFFFVRHSKRQKKSLEKRFSIACKQKEDDRMTLERRKEGKIFTPTLLHKVVSSGKFGTRHNNTPQTDRLRIVLDDLTAIPNVLCFTFFLYSVHCQRRKKGCRRRRQIQFLNLDKPATMKNAKLVTISFFGVCGNFLFFYMLVRSLTHSLTFSRKNMLLIIPVCLLFRQWNVAAPATRSFCLIKGTHKGEFHENYSCNYSE